MSSYLPHAARLRTLLSLLDTAAMVAAVWLAYTLRFKPSLRATKWDELLEHPLFLVLALLAGLALGAAGELYEPELLHRRREVMIRVLVSASAWMMTLVFITYLVPGLVLGRGVLLLTTLFWIFALVASRWSLTWWLRRRARFRALVVGEPEATLHFCRQLRDRPAAPWAPVDGSAIPLQNIPNAVTLHGASIVVLAGGDESAMEMGTDLASLHFSGVPVVAASEVWAWLEERLPLEALSPAIFLHQPGFGAVHWTLMNRITRIVDIVLAILILLLSLPLFLLAATLVLLTDGSPVLYRQVRVGQFGRNFTMFKLRTMRRDAEASGPVFSQEGDPRTLRVGRVLRRFRIDELPQLLNVLKGEMSLVGPRPERPEFVERLTREIPYYAFRTAVLPGITGWAQVNVPYAADLAAHRRKLEFDLYFIRERSTRLYLLTLLRTPSTALVGARR
jgi:exopolysaccharide biosynthesis polyprenyl glycosylphosphotransferase